MGIRTVEQYRPAAMTFQIQQSSQTLRPRIHKYLFVYTLVYILVLVRVLVKDDPLVFPGFVYLHKYAPVF